MATKRLVLVVEDDAATREALLAIIADEPDLDAVGVDSAEEALRLTSTIRADLVLLDLVLPTPEAGLELARRLRANPTMARVPIVAMTALSAAMVADRVRAVGCDGLVEKPFTLDDLFATIRPFLERRGTG